MARHIIKITTDKMTNCLQTHMLICDCCKQEIESRGEKLISYGKEYATDDTETLVCDWCNEEEFTELEEVAFA